MMKSGCKTVVCLSAILLLSLATAKGEDTASAATPPAEEWTKPVPINFFTEYALVSDYVWRGINLSEYAGEGREDLNHQWLIGGSVTTPIGNIGGSTWFEWFAGQDKFTPGEGNLQEVDYTVNWNYTWAPLGMTTELGWLSYTFPPYDGDIDTTNEGYVKLSFDDSKWFGAKKPVLSPYVYYGMDLDWAEGDSWIETGVSHEFAMADNAAMSEMAILKDISLIPAVVLGIDHRYLDNFAFGPGQEATRLAFLNYGLTVKYNLSSALKIPAKYGGMYVAGFVNYSDALRRDMLNDEFYGGLKVGYTW